MFSHPLASSLTPSHRILLVSSHYFSSLAGHSYGLYTVSFDILFPGACPPRFSFPREEAIFNLGGGNKATRKRWGGGRQRWRDVSGGEDGNDKEDGKDNKEDGGDDVGDGNEDNSLRTIFPGARPPNIFVGM